MVSDEEMEVLSRKVSNWGRWGPEDQRGTLNNMTAEHVAAAGGLIQAGESVSLARDLPLGTSDKTLQSSHLVWRHNKGTESASEYISLVFHGIAITHLDALCHILREGKMYNGFPADDITLTGSPKDSVLTMASGVVGRGVLLDVAGVRGRALEGSEMVTPEDLLEAERRGGASFGTGDLVFVRTGAKIWVRDPASPGLSPNCVPLLHERQVSVLAADVANDPHPLPRAPWWNPVHQLTMYYMGMLLIDNCDLEPLAEACARHDGYAFFCSLAPLRINGGTGSPINPLAIF